MRGHTITGNWKADSFLRAQSERLISAVGWPVGFNRHTFLAGVLVFLGYYLGAKIGLALTFLPYPVSVMWPPNSILMAALLLNPSRLWWFLLLCAFPAHLAAELASGVPLAMVLSWFVSNAAEALVGAVGTRLLLGSSPRFDQLRGLGLLFVCGGLLAPLLTSFLDSAFVAFNRFGQQSYWEVWRMRCFSNVFAGLVVLPVLVTWSGEKFAPPGEKEWRRRLEVALVFGGLLVVSLSVFCWQENGPAMNPALLYLPLPFIFWAAVRFGSKGTSTAILMVALLAIWGAVHGRGPFILKSPEQNARAIQFFFIVISITFMFLATSIMERSQVEERFAKAFRSSPDAMIVSHLEDDRIVEVNGRWERMFGYGRDETIGRTTLDMNIYASEVEREKLMAGTHNGTSVHDLELCLRTKMGELCQVQISADTDEIGGKQCLITVIRDVSDRKRAEEVQQNLAHLSRLAVMGEMTAMVAHEVNQPLGAILSNAEAAEMLLDSKEPPLNEIRQILSDIRKNDLRADQAIRRIGGLLRRREIRKQPLDLNETISDVLELVAGDALRRHIIIRKEFGQELPQAFGDKAHLQQVLLNLAVNAMDAMKDKPESARRLMLQTQRNGEHILEVLVSDSGHGVPPDRMDRIFESFFTTKKDGMGLGLSIARSIIEAHQGQIWAESNSEGGATFHFTIPTAESVAAQGPKGSA
jgi:two-component system sensor kinase FixL